MTGMRHDQDQRRRTTGRGLVGDRLETDIACGNRAGLTTIAVLTGVATRETIAGVSGDLRPDYVLPSVAALQ